MKQKHAFKILGHYSTSVEALESIRPPPPRKAHCAEQTKRTVQNEVRKTQKLGGQSSDMVSKTTLKNIYFSGHVLYTSCPDLF